MNSKLVLVVLLAAIAGTVHVSGLPATVVKPEQAQGANAWRIPGYPMVDEEGVVYLVSCPGIDDFVRPRYQCPRSVSINAENPLFSTRITFNDKSILYYAGASKSGKCIVNLAGLPPLESSLAFTQEYADYFCQYILETDQRYGYIPADCATRQPTRYTGMGKVAPNGSGFVDCFAF